MAPIRITSRSSVDSNASTTGTSTPKSGESRLSQRSSPQFDALSKRPSSPRPGPNEASTSSAPMRTDKPLPSVPPNEPASKPPAASASGQRPAKPLPAIPGKPGNVHSFVPPKAESGGGFARFANMLGANRKGVHAVGLASKKPMNNILNAASSNEHGKFAYDAAPATELVNAAASGSTAMAAHNISKRYGNKVNDMLAADVARFEAASSMAGTPGASLNQGLVKPKELTPAQELAFRRNPSVPENQLITKDAKGNWQYDKAKLTRIAKDTSHPDSTHARDVLATMSIAENKGKQRRGAALATLGSGIGVAATTAQIVGTHGAITPALVAGHAGLGGKEALELKKPFVEARQDMRNEKSDEVLRHVNRRMDELPPLPADAPIGAKAGAYAVAYESARRNAAQQNNFGFRIPGSMINDRKSATVKSDAQDLANKHISSIAQNGIKAASENSLTQLGSVDKELNLTKSQREKRAMEHINGDADLKAVHTLLTDTGIPRGEAAMLMSKMSEHSLSARKADAAPAPAKATADADEKPLTPAEERTKIADIIGEPTLKPADPVKDAEGKIKSGLALRS
ncbi:conserved hypothetical protein [Paraburkholderia sabiae]|uniref:hypothetical protein n=1 Tax=Paraburkholderia sabiae TaxID=273251 RepID=UPI001CB09CE7|nr:hypothetical protein [Paraburkholderia sabiae]CAG9207848.1 conserved hypothetical protein [Paraburkholderia sabiae]